MGGGTTPISDKVFKAILELGHGRLIRPKDIPGLLNMANFTQRLSTGRFLDQLQLQINFYKPDSYITTLVSQLRQPGSWETNGDGVLSVPDINATLARLKTLLDANQAALTTSISAELQQALGNLRQVALVEFEKLANAGASVTVESFSSRIDVRRVLQLGAPYNATQTVQSLVDSLLTASAWSSGPFVTATSINTAIDRLLPSVAHIVTGIRIEAADGLQGIFNQVYRSAQAAVIAAPSPNDRILPVLLSDFQSLLTKRRSGVLDILKGAISGPSGSFGPGILSKDRINRLLDVDGWDVLGNRDGLASLADVASMITDIHLLMKDDTARNVLAFTMPRIAGGQETTFPEFSFLVVQASKGSVDGIGSFLMDQLGSQLKDLTESTIGGLLSDTSIAWAKPCAAGLGAANSPGSTLGGIGGCLSGASGLIGQLAGDAALGSTFGSIGGYVGQVGNLISAFESGDSKAMLKAGLSTGLAVAGTAFLGPVGGVLGSVLGNVIGGLFRHRHLLACPDGSPECAPSTFWHLVASLDDHTALVSPQRQRFLQVNANGTRLLSTSAQRAAEWDARMRSLKSDLDAAMALGSDVTALAFASLSGNSSLLSNPAANLLLPEDTGIAMTLPVAAVTSRLAAMPKLTGYLSSYQEQMGTAAGVKSQQDIADMVDITKRFLGQVQAVAASSRALQLVSLAEPSSNDNDNGPQLLAGLRDGSCMVMDLQSLDPSSSDPRQVLTYLTTIVYPQRAALRAARVSQFLQVSGRNVYIVTMPGSPEDSDAL